MNIEEAAMQQAEQESQAAAATAQQQHAWAVQKAEQITQVLTEQGLSVQYVREKHFHGDVVWQHQGFGDDPCLIRVWPSYTAGRVEGHIGVLPPMSFRHRMARHDAWIPVDKDLHNLVSICTEVLKHALKASIE